MWLLYCLWTWKTEKKEQILQTVWAGDENSSRICLMAKCYIVGVGVMLFVIHYTYYIIHIIGGTCFLSYWKKIGIHTYLYHISVYFDAFKEKICGRFLVACHYVYFYGSNDFKRNNSSKTCSICKQRERQCLCVFAIVCYWNENIFFFNWSNA